MSEGPRPPRTPEEARRFLSQLAGSGIRLGLHQVRQALQAIGSPEQDYPALHVAGTNGKGSTCAFAASCLWAEGYRVGLYTSPHLVRLNERIQINGDPISDPVLDKRVLEVLERYPQAAEWPAPLTFFELLTAVALWHFSQEKVEVAVLETGLGGRLDATNTAKSVVTAITPISLDHLDYLGDNLAAIAAEKAGILKPAVPAVLSLQPPEALQVLLDSGLRVTAPTYLEGRDYALSPQPDGAHAYRGLRTEIAGIRLGLRGHHQVQNAAVALAALELLADVGLRVSAANLRKGVASTHWPGRLEEFGRQPAILLDGAHNPGAMEVLLASLKELYPGRRIHLVFGVLADKDHLSMLQRLLPVCRSAHLAPVPSPRSLSPQKYEAEAHVLCANTRTYPSPEDALKGAIGMAGPQDLVVCTGSLFLVGAVRAYLTTG
jgi:dihydrofolate synthase/folylpolyglutamate synthase